MISRKLLKSIYRYNKDGSFTRIKKLGNSTKLGEKFFGTTEKEGYKVCEIYGKQYRFHRLVFLYHYGWLPKTIDHIDNDRANNRIENLRPASLSQNQFNSKIPITNTSGFKNIHYNSYARAWKASIRIGNKRFSKQSVNKEKVILWIKEKRKELHGNFAREK